MGLAFDEQSVRRIVRSVLYTERANRSRAARSKKGWRPQGEGDARPIGFDRCTCVAVSAVASTSATFQVQQVVATRGDSPLVDPDSATEQLTVVNDFRFRVDAGGRVAIEHWASDGAWHAYQAQCPAS